MITEDELAAIMADHARYADPWEYRDLAETVADHVPALVAEVRRLRQALQYYAAAEDQEAYDSDGALILVCDRGPAVALAALAGDAATAGPATGG